MNAYPNMIASHGFICSELLRDTNIVAKGGAKGFYAFGLKEERIAFALKVIDGSEAPWPIICCLYSGADRILQQGNDPPHV